MNLKRKLIMKTKTILILALSLLSITCLHAQNQTEMKKFEPQIRQVEEIHMVYYEFVGPYDQSFNDFGALMHHIQSNNLKMGPYSLGVFYDDPEVVPANELKSEIGFMTAGPVEESGKYKSKTIASGKAVSVRYTSMDDIYPAYEAISNFIKENSLTTVPYSVEIYYSANPSVIDAEILMFINE